MPNEPEAMGLLALMMLLEARRPARTASDGALIPLGEQENLLVTVHPSYLLRLQEEDAKRREWRAFLADLALAQRSLVETALPTP